MSHQLPVTVLLSLSPDFRWTPRRNRFRFSLCRTLCPCHALTRRLRVTANLS